MTLSSTAVESQDRCVSPATEDWPVSAYQALREGNVKKGSLDRKQSFCKSKVHGTASWIWEIVQGSPCLENGWCRKRDAKSEVWRGGKGESQGEG